MIDQLISHKCWFCKKSWKENIYANTKTCDNHNLIIHFNHDFIGTSVEFKTPLVNACYATEESYTNVIKQIKAGVRWYWESPDLDVVSYKHNETSIKLNVSIFDLIKLPWEEVNSKLKTLQLFI
jgi:hypothetical protein